MKIPLFRSLFSLLVCLLPLTATAQVVSIPEPVPPPFAVREVFELDPFYQQWIDVEGFPVVASEKVNPYALKEAAWLIWQMIGHRPDVLHVLVQKKVRFSVIGHTEILTDIPEYSDSGPDFLLFARRGLGGSGLSGHPAVSSSEENLLEYQGSYDLYSVMIHEFGHTIHLFGLNPIDPTFDSRLKIAYDAAMEKGLWQGTYASSDRREYWAEGTHAWFYPKGRSSFKDNTRQALKAYDPGLAALLTEVYDDSEWRYTPSATRTHLPHLQGFSPQDSPTFQGFPALQELLRQFIDPNLNGGDEWVNLRPYDPSLLPSLLNESRTAGPSTMIAFMNLSQADIFVYSVGRAGTEGYWTHLPPSPWAFREHGCKANDIWLIKDPNGRNLAVFRAAEKTGRAMVETNPILITPGLSKISGDNQTGVSGAALANPFVVEVRDENGSVLEGISVTFTVTAGGGTLSVTRPMTDANGRAESTFTLGPKPGTNTVSVSAAGIEPPITFNAVAETTIDLPDTSLRAAVETALGKAEDDSITPSEMATLTRLEANNANISDLTGFEFATHLKALWLDGEEVVQGTWRNSNSVSDLSPLAGLTNLERLGLWQNSVEDLSPLAGLTKLTELYLGINSVKDLSPLAELTNLESLFLDSNGILNLSPLAGLIKLTRLSLSGNSIKDLSPLTGLTNLKWMSLAWNSISDLAPLVANTGLGSGDTVDVRGNPLSHLSIHTHIPTLQSREVIVEFDNRTLTSPLKISGDDQQGTPGTALERSFVVEVRDASGSVFEGVPVTFTVTAGGGTLSVTSVTTDSNGRAESTLTLGPNPGTNTVTVSVAGIQEGQTFNAEGIGVPKTLEIVSGDDQEGLPGAALDKAFVVEVRNQSDKPLPEVQVTFSVTNGGGTLSATSVTTDANGRAESRLTLGPNPGTNTVTVSVAGITQAETFNAEGVRIPKTLEIVSGENQKGLPGAALDNPFVVEVRDQTDKPLPDAQVTFSVTSGGGTLSSTSATMDSSGRAESTLTLGPNPGTNTVTVSVAGIQETRTFTAESIRIPKTLEIVSGKDQKGLPGEALAKPFVVEVRDQTGEPLLGIKVMFSVTGGGGTLSVTNATTDSSGRAESTLTLGPIPGTNTVTVSVTGIQAEQTFTAEGIRIPKTLEIVSGKDQKGLPGAALDNPFVVEVRDQTDKPLPEVQVTFSVTSGGGTLSSTSATTDSNGRAESTLTLGPNPGTNTVSVSVTGIQTEQTFTAEGIRIPLAFWIISGDKQQGLPGEALAKPFVVEVRDRSGEPLPGVLVTFSVTSGGGGTLSVTSATTESGGRAESILTLGPNLGTNTVTVSVTGILEEQSISATAEPPPIPQDVNRDDIVNILDLVLVASDLGDEGADLMADVNGDGVVNILDLVLVAGAFGDAAAAPSAQAPQTLTAANVQTWLTDARSLAGKDAMIKKGIVVLEQLLAAFTPPETALLLNFPNPFNPETWIPYQLAENASVTLTIYDMTGVVVRRLDLGHRMTGFYESRSKAIYWDGKNGLGERVASGIYFYTLTAGDYTATRKMVILQ